MTNKSDCVQKYQKNQNLPRISRTKIVVGQVYKTTDKGPTFDVTLGFPSLSPPIQDPNFIGVQVNGRGFPVC